MVGRDYLLSKPSPPSASRVFLDQRVVPRVVNAAGAFEVALDRASVRTGLRPAAILAGSVGLLSLTAVYLWRRRTVA